MPQLRKKSETRRRLNFITGSELGRPHARLDNPNTGIPEVIIQPLYDIYALAAAQVAVALRLFSVTQGQAYNFGGVTSFIKTQNHTNLVQSGMLESSYTFIVRALSVFVQGNQGATNAPYVNIVDLGNLLATFCQFNINRKSYYDGIVGWLPAGGGSMTGGAGVGSTTQAVLQNTNGLPYAKNMYLIPGGQYINPQENFDFQINPTFCAGGAWSTVAAVAPGVSAPASGLMAWVRLDGTLIRVAQ